MNDRKVSELILKAYQQSLTDDETRYVEAYLKQNDTGRSFAMLSQAIQDAIDRFAIAQVDDPENPIEGLSEPVRERMKQAVRDALAKRSGLRKATPSDRPDSMRPPDAGSPSGGAMLAAEKPPEYTSGKQTNRPDPNAPPDDS